MADQPGDEGFKVTDRRSFNADGSPREQGEAAAKPDAVRLNKDAAPDPGDFAEDARILPDGGRPNAADKKATSGSEGYQERAATRDFPPPTFDSFINMLAVEAAVHLGLVPNPLEEGEHIDLPAARHMIDTLGMLQAKTTGNLTAGEADLLETILANLRLQYVEVSRTR